MTPSRIRQAVTYVVWFAVCVAGTASPLAAQSLDEGRDSLRAGRYDAAARILAKVGAGDDWAPAQQFLVLALRSTGKYQEAEDAARRATTSGANGKELWNSLGVVLYDRGRVSEAEAAFKRAIADHASDSLSAALNLAVLHYERGELDASMKEFDHFIDVYNNGGGQLTAREIAAVAVACRYLGANNPQLFKDALTAFDRSISLDSDDQETQSALGELFLEKYNGEDAQKTFAEVLSANPWNPRALLGAARQRDFDNEPGADSLVERALTVNPSYADARVFKAQMAVDREDYAGARREIDRALATDPSSSRALGVLAGIYRIQGDSAKYAETMKRALALNPRDAELFNTIADLTAKVRRYREAANLAKQGLALDPKSWRGWGLLGMNQLRLGQIDEGKAALDKAFAGDPYDVWIKNTLDLLDTFKNYDVTKSQHFIFMVEKSESALLTTYLGDLAEQAYATFSKRYAYTPPPPVRIEVYRSHADFSVRTVGLAGLGALGVSFGTTLAFDSPAAKDAGPFNWGSTVWHELAHTFTLGLTEHRVPRWLSEGLSVYEEHRARPGWGFGPTPGFLLAFKDGRLVPVSRMNDGFMHPAYPEQVQYSYYQASLVCELIAREYGEDALRKMLEGYRAGLTTDQVFERVLKTDPKSFDKKFDGYLRERFAKTLAGIKQLKGEEAPAPSEIVARASADPSNVLLQLSAGQVLLQTGRMDEAMAAFERAKALFPEYGGPQNAYAGLAAIHKSKGDTKRAAQELATLGTLSEIDYSSSVELADLLSAIGDKAGAAAALERAIFMNPYDRAQHERLAGLYKALGETGRVVRERRAIVALAPVDRASALYQLALAQHEAGDAAGARKSVLRALEDAPNYADAQKLLLTLYEARHGTGMTKP